MKKTQRYWRKNYQAPSWLVDQVNLEFDIRRSLVKVTTCLLMHANLEAVIEPCTLEGSAKLLLLELEGRRLLSNEYRLANDKLILLNTPKRFKLKIITEIYPHKNKKLMGLYASRGILLTQCEPEGFRQITYYPDRPDVMASFTTRLIASKKHYPVLLSNGNKIDSGKFGQRHWVKWQDPHKKPAYLFAMVAGDLVVKKDQFVRQDGQITQLQIWTEKSDQHKVNYAMACLKEAMAWDEHYFGLSYDLATYMIVAVKDFNAGAMENKGLNIFNAHYILADETSATDEELMTIKRVIAHEYFHNWTGNRVTCKNWFELCLKEGLTVFREQLFCETTAQAPISRIQDVTLLRTVQFAEDAGPTAHPIRPDSYLEINNFYTTTVYEKGAEVVRLYQTFLGNEIFKQGLLFYLKKYDGKATTCDDFCDAMSESSKANLAKFKRWYGQSGTPNLFVKAYYKKQNHTYTLTIFQKTPKTADQRKKIPLPIPLALTLFDKKGIPIKLTLDTKHGRTFILRIEHSKERFTFHNILDEPTPSFLHDFSAPVKLNFDWKNEQLVFLIMHDTNLFGRWEASQQLTRKMLQASYCLEKNDIIYQNLYKAWSHILADESLDEGYKALLLTLPSGNEMLGWFDYADPQRIHQTLQALSNQLAKDFLQQWQNIWNHTTDQLANHQKNAQGIRALRNLSIVMLTKISKDAMKIAEQQFLTARNMTDQMGALEALKDSDTQERTRCLEAFYKRWEKDDVVIDKYFYLIASSQLPQTYLSIKKALKDPIFRLQNPNKAFALLGTLLKNLSVFHAVDGRTYQLVAKKIIQIDSWNPQVASFLTKGFSCFKKIEGVGKKQMERELKKILAAPNLSKNVKEIIEKIMAPPIFFSC